MLPPEPAEEVTVQYRIFAEHSVVEPLFAPVQFQFHGPLPVGVLAVDPTAQRSVVGADVNVPPLEDPQVPVTGRLVLMLNLIT